MKENKSKVELEKEENHEQKKNSPDNKAEAIKAKRQKTSKTEKASLKEIEKDLEKARQEAAEYLDSLQRLKAEFENFRKRMIREQSEFLRLANQRIISDLLPVIDSFDRAMKVLESGEADEKFHQGIKMVYQQLEDTLAKEGLKEINPEGEEFDPLKHEAMMQVESQEHKENMVVEVLEKGYELKGRVIRPAKVKVAK
jgi:molecular chaperone GrpE